jgi:hypothetical protein
MAWRLVKDDDGDDVDNNNNNNNNNNLSNSILICSSNFHSCYGVWTLMENSVSFTTSTNGLSFHKTLINDCMFRLTSVSSSGGMNTISATERTKNKMQSNIETE